MSSVSTTPTSSTEQNTIQYTRLLAGGNGGGGGGGSDGNKSANTSMSSEKGGVCRPTSHYPTVCVQVPHAPLSSVSAPPRDVPYAVPYPKPIQYSATQLQYENIKHRCKMLDNENQRLMRVQNELITDANRRVEMHVNEIRMLKEENKKLVAANKELRELCCFLDDDRQKTRRLAKEWQKFGRYTSQVMKQEMSMNQQRLRESEERHMEAIRENEELKQLCLYLDEQRQRFTNYRAEDDRESEDLGCGSSERSEDCDDSKYTCDIPGINPQKEDTLRLISQRMESSVVSVHSVANEQSVRSEQLLDYIHSLEGRIKQLEKASQQNGIWHSACTLESESDEKTVIDRCDEFSNGVIIANGSPRDPKAMQTSYCSTLTTSGTTYASSETDMESAVYVMGDETDGIESLQVRSLARIEEEDKDKSLDEVEEESAKLPPTIAPLSLLNVARLSLTNSELSLSLNRSFEESQPRRCSSSSAVPIAAPLVQSPRRHRIAWKNTVFGVVKVPFNRGSNTEETGITAVRDSRSNRCGITAV